MSRDPAENDRPRPPRTGRPKRRGPARTSGKAVGSLVFGFLSFCLTILAGIPAIALGVMGLRDVSRGDGKVGGRGMAVAGIALGALGSVTSLALVILGIPAYQNLREAQAREKTSDNLKQIGLAFHGYNTGFQRFPGPGAESTAFQPSRNLSWRVAILPAIEYQQLYFQFKLDEPWDSPANLPLLKKMPKLYRAPGGPDDSTTTPYRVFVGGGAMFEWDQFTRSGDLKDAPSGTIMVAEAADEVPWTKPEELEYDPKGPLPRLGRGRPGRFTAAMADHSVRTFDLDRIGESGLRALITRAGGDEAPTD
jgi:hypothetical protein